MKHIKSKKLFESITDYEISDIKDICLELGDKGFNVQVNSVNIIPATKYNVWIVKSIQDTYVEFLYSEVEEVIDRLKDYLGDKITNIDVNVDYYWTNINSRQGDRISQSANQLSGLRGISIKIK
jgi:hypothetical protein